MKSRRSNKNATKKEAILFVLIEVFIIASVFLTYRRLRYFFPKPLMEDAIGYAQYFGYPLYFDNFIFLIIILSPVFAFLIKRVIKKYL